MDKDFRCPECGSRKIGKGKMDGYAVLRPADKLFSTGSRIVADICSNCGLIIQMRVKKPEKFKGQ